MFSQAHGAAHNCSNRAAEEAAAATMEHHFAADPIFFIGKSESGGSGSNQVRVRVVNKIKASAANEELDILQSKGCIVGCCARVFTRAEQVETSNHNHVSNALASGRTMGSICQVEHGMNVLDWDWFDARRGWISSAIGTKLPLDAEVNVAYAVFPRVFGPQAGKRLAHGT
jgi:hypothetical protein